MTYDSDTMQNSALLRTCTACLRDPRKQFAPLSHGQSDGSDDIHFVNSFTTLALFSKGSRLTTDHPRPLGPLDRPGPGPLRPEALKPEMSLNLNEWLG